MPAGLGFVAARGHRQQCGREREAAQAFQKLHARSVEESPAACKPGLHSRSCACEGTADRVICRRAQTGDQNPDESVAFVLQINPVQNNNIDNNPQNNIDKEIEALVELSKKLGDQIEKKLKDEQKRYDATQSSTQTKQEDTSQSVVILTQKLKDEQKRADTLQQKLDALTNIENAIIERQQQGKPELKK